jgi:Sec23/Sec24 trunk domain.
VIDCGEQAISSGASHLAAQCIKNILAAQPKEWPVKAGIITYNGHAHFWNMNV